MPSKLVLVQFFLLLPTIQCARILVVLPSAFYSHQLPLRLLYKELSLRGHRVVAITTNPLNDSALVNLTEIDVGYVNRYIRDVNFARLYAERNIYTNTLEFLTALGDVAEEIFADPNVQRLLDDGEEHFDLVMVEWCAHPAFAALAKRFNSPLIGFRSLELRPMCHEALGNPTNPSYIPTGTTDFQSGFWGRLHNFLVYLAQVLLHNFVMVPRARNILQKHLRNVSVDVEEAERSVSVVITTTNPILNGVRPVVPNYIQVAGLHLSEPDQKISPELGDFLESSKEGVIYLNFGSVLNKNDLDGKQLQVLTTALGKLPYKVLWKLNSHAFSEQLPQNIKMFAWVPQRAVLAHRNVKLFLTHGGALSYQEAVHFKIPMVGFPFCGDQFTNVNRMIQLKIGRRLDYYSMDENAAISTIRDVMENSTYRKSVSRISDMVKDQEMMAPMEKAIWWIEYVLRHNGASFLRSDATKLNLIQYLLLDVIAFLLAVAFLTFIVTLKAIAMARLGIGYVFHGRKKSKVA